MNDLSAYLAKLRQRLSGFSVETWVVLVLEAALAAVLIYFDVNFWIDIGNGITFLGPTNHGYEITVSIVLLLLALMMLFLVGYDLFVRDYKAERAAVRPKIVRNGHVIGLDDEKARKSKKNK